MASFRRRRRLHVDEVTPDLIFLDATNLPHFDTQQFEGRIERPISKFSIAGLVISSALLVGILAWNTADLQIVHGEAFLARSEKNTLRHIPIFAERGVLYDRNGVLLAWNGKDHREYVRDSGLAHVVGYTGSPNKEEIEIYHPDQTVGRAGAELAFNEQLVGRNGLRLVERDVFGSEVSASIFERAVRGSDVTLTVDSRIQKKLYTIIRDLAVDRKFIGGAGLVLDVHTGEVIALVSYPEYDPQVLADGDDARQIALYAADPQTPFLNRAISGVYTPGSIVKPFIGIGALVEGVVTPDTKIVSTGAITVPNPFNPANESRFVDWKAHGSVALRDALAVSSNVYFYEVGGGYRSQPGIGIRGIEKYMRMFGIGTDPTGIELAGEAGGIVPTPEWKALNFTDEPWRIGDTYHTAIGQFGFGVTVMQMARAVAAISTNGVLVTPRILQSRATDKGQDIIGFLRTPETEEVSFAKIDIPAEHFAVIREGIREAVERGTASGFSGLGVQVAAKTGTAELGESKQRVNSWVIGYFPYESPRYAFAVVMEKGSRSNTIGGVYAMRQLLEWMQVHTPEYLQ
ncbi:MAG: hypothetical protein HYS59_02170 [Candidatus Vogelbacteria bacterium]|nr:hypothetical protein [Candidatus Vogelbacteria bacterium]